MTPDAPPAEAAASGEKFRSCPSILTNMAFWQSRLWMRHAHSIYDLQPGHEPEPFSPLMEAIRLFRRRKRYEVVVTMGARTSLYYGLLCAAAGVDARQVMCEVFLDPERGGWRYRFKTALYRLVARRSLGILTNSSMEVAAVQRRYRLSADRVMYVPMHTNIRDPHETGTDEGFVLSAGRTWRDYPTLLAALRGLASVRAIIICGRRDLRGASLPSGVEIRREVPRDVYLDLLRRCRLVAVPLLPVERATGQVVVLEAMALAKPVVATRTSGTLDLVVDGRTGILVPPRDPDALRSAVARLLADRDLARRMGRAGLDRVLREFTIETHAAQARRY